MAVVVNLGLVGPVGASYLSAWGQGERPGTSVTNSSGPGVDYAASALAVVELDAQGGFRVFSKAESDAFADVVAYVTGESAPVDTSGLTVLLPGGPQRRFDTRESQPEPGPKGRLGAGGEVTVSFDGTVGLPGPEGLGLVVVNVTGTEADLGYVTAFEAGEERPLASMLNLMGPPLRPLDTRPNLAFVPVNDHGDTTFFTLNPTHLLADVTAYTLP